VLQANVYSVLLYPQVFHVYDVMIEHHGNDGTVPAAVMGKIVGMSVLSCILKRYICCKITRLYSCVG